MSAVYSIFTSPHHPPVPDHLPTLIVTPNGRPNQILYTYLHTNLNTENYLLTPSEAGDLCVAKLFPPDKSGLRSAASSASHGSGAGSSSHVRCEASRNLRWNISQAGIANPIYKLTLPNPDSPGDDQPLFQISKPNPNANFHTIFYFAYAGHLIPPRRIEFGRIQKNPPEAGGGTRVAITGKSDEEKAVWKTLGEGNEDMVEWIVICAALVVLDDDITAAAEKAGMGAKLRAPAAGPSGMMVPPSPQRQRTAPMPPGSPSRRGMEPPRSATAPPAHGQQRMPPPQPQFNGHPPPPHHGQPQHPPHSQQQHPPPQRGYQLQDGPSRHPEPRQRPSASPVPQPRAIPPHQQQYPQHPHPQQQQYPQQRPPPQQQHQQQQQYPHPSQQPHPSQHPQQSQQPHHFQPPPRSGSRQPSSYRPGPPGPRPAGALPPGAGTGPGAGGLDSSSSMFYLNGGGVDSVNDGGAAARMVQQQVEMRRQQQVGAGVRQH
ncbi:hypothetical protein JCM8547_007196 [Rhodosporidiobolus lusitaniae]